MREIFLKQSYEDARMDYQYMCGAAEADGWDWVVVTASNQKQAETYRTQIEERIVKHKIPVSPHYLVVPDWNGRRIGSGGATLSALYEIANSEGSQNIAGKKILLIHAGGDSKRIPQYSACGKLFQPVPRKLEDGTVSTLFDEILMMSAGMTGRMKSGLLIMPSDTELLFNVLQADLMSCDAAGLSMKAGVEEGVRHGVFLQSDNCSDGRNYNVGKFLHKRSKNELETEGAVDSSGDVNIDTGCIWFGESVVNAMMDMIKQDGKLDESELEKYVNEKVCLNVYGDFLYPLAENSTLEEFLKEPPENKHSEELEWCRKRIWEALSGFRLSLVKFAPAKYIHFGTTSEMYRMVVNSISDFRCLGWEPRINTNVQAGTSINSYVDGDSTIGKGTYLENSVIVNGSVVGDGSIISTTVVDAVNIPDGIVLHTLKLGNGRYVSRIYGKEDNPKAGKTSSFLNGTLTRLLRVAGINDADLWQDDAATIWNARLYPVCVTEKESVERALCLYRIMAGESSEQERKDWISAERLSLKGSYMQADTDWIVDMGNRVAGRVRLEEAKNAVRLGKSFQDFYSAAGAEIDEDFIGQLYEYIKGQAFPENMRGYLYLSDLCRRHKGDTLSPQELEDDAYDAIRYAIVEDAERRGLFGMEGAHFVKEQHEVKLPVRVNFCGSPSDAAPYCIERGGTMLDAALLLRGEMPVSVTVRKLDEPVIVCESLDLRSRTTFTKISEIRDCGDPNDTFALHKAVLLACGLVPLNGEISLGDICRKIGGGLSLSTFVDIPKGSGLGTSSILAAGGITAVTEILGTYSTEQRIYSQVFVAEQLMGTGGGWQDQVGGLTEGIKYFTSEKGIAQHIKVEKLDLPEQTVKELNDRFCLIFSGQRRLARNVLREEMNQCIRQDSEAMDAVEKIRECCAAMKYQLERGNITGFAKYITRQFELVKSIDQGASNTCIEYIFEVCGDLLDGKSICGAGGGGFLQVILKEGVDKEKLQKRIAEEFGDCGVELWECTLI